MFPKNSLVPSLSSAVASSPGLCTQLKNTVWSWRDTEDYSAHQKGSKGGVYLCWGSGEERVAVLPGQADEDITKQTSELDLRSWSQVYKVESGLCRQKAKRVLAQAWTVREHSMWLHVALQGGWGASEYEGVMRVYAPRFSVSSQQKFGVTNTEAPRRVTALGGQTVLQVLNKSVLQLYLFRS